MKSSSLLIKLPLEKNVKFWIQILKRQKLKDFLKEEPVT